jgi:hypothetical protein
MRLESAEVSCSIELVDTTGSEHNMKAYAGRVVMRVHVVEVGNNSENTSW